MKRILPYKIFEKTKYNKESNTLIVKKGSVLFHGTGEDYNIKDVKPGTYDNIFWTSNSSQISQTYIPVSNSTLSVNTDGIRKAPRKNSNITDIQEQFGIVYTDIEYAPNGTPQSFYRPKIWKGINDETTMWVNEYHRLKEDYNKKRSDLADGSIDISDSGEKKRVYREIANMKSDIDQMETEFHIKGDSTKKENEYINKKLMELGYVPEYEDTYSSNNSWKLNVKFIDGKERVLPSDHREKGRLLIIKAKEDLELYDNTLGGSTEGDLTNLEYHNHSLFTKIKDSGYDGVVINDFAQSESEGNFGHLSYGFFEKTLSKLDMESIPASHPENLTRETNFESEEYRDYLKNN